MSTLLAPQSISASLKIKNKATKIDEFQSASDQYVKYYDVFEASNDVDYKNYSITNLPGTISSVPINSIFSFISVVLPESPDYRLVPVRSCDSKLIKTGLGTTSDIKVLENVIVGRNKPSVSGKSIFRDDLPDSVGGNANEGASSIDAFRQQPNNEDVESLIEYLGDDPLKIDAKKAFSIVRVDTWKPLHKEIKKNSVRVRNLKLDANLATTEILKAMTRLANPLDEATIEPTLQEKNKHMNFDTAKIGITRALIALIDDEDIKKISQEDAYEFARIVNGSVEARRERDG